MTDKEIEDVARAICKRAGLDPDRRMRYYRRSEFTYPQWEDFRKEAKTMLKERDVGSCS